MNLTIEQDLQVRLFQDSVDLMPEADAKGMLVEMYKQWLSQENRIKAGELGQVESFISDDYTCDYPTEARGWGEE